MSTLNCNGFFFLFKTWILILTFGCPVGNAAGTSLLNTPYYENAVFHENIKSVKAHRVGNELSNPEYVLGGDAGLVVKFDDLSDEIKNYSYTVVHCDANWYETNIRQNQYLEGLPDVPVTDYAMSDNTTVQYVNYQINIPSEDCNPLLSGNYVLLVYEDNDREKLVLVQRFFVLEPLIHVDGQVKKATLGSLTSTSQELDFKVYIDQLKLANPYEDIKVVITQNRRWDNAIKNLKPSAIKDNCLIYDYNKENVFPGGNEFRFFDIRTFRHTGENVTQIDFLRPYYHAKLAVDEVRSNKDYNYYREMNGNFVVESEDRISDFDTQCDYEYVHFFLPLNSQLNGGNVYVFGALTGLVINHTNQMKWNYELGGYELFLLLKQGYYNYQYVYVPKGLKKIDAENLEGSFDQTENDYQIFVYYRDQAKRYDRLVGFVVLNSIVKNQKY